MAICGWPLFLADKNMSEPKTLALAGFSSPAFAIAALGLPISAILPPLYAELGLSLTVVGTVFMLTRFFDGFTDPVFGVLGDRIKTRWGRRRPALLFSIPFLLFGVYRVFMPGESVTETDLLISMLILYIGWTMFTLAHTAWASELTTSYDGRSRVMSFLQYFGMAGMIGVLMMPLLVDLFVAEATMFIRAEAMGWLILVSVPVLTMVAFISMPEPSLPVTRQPPWREAWKIFKRSAALRRLLVADLLTGFQGGVNGAVHFFFVIHVLLLPRSASLFLVAMFVMAFVCVPLFLKLSYRFSKHRALCIGAIHSCLTCLCFLILPVDSFWLALFLFTNIGVNVGGSAFLMRAMMADIVDEDRAETGAERSALFFSILTLTPKLGAALAVGLVFPMLDWVGFSTSGNNSSETLDGVRVIVAITPAVVAASVALVLWKYPLDRAAQERIRVKLS